MSDNPLKDAKFGNSLFISDFPVKIRVLTRDPVVSVDNYGNTRYAFVVWNVDESKPQIINKGPGFTQRFQEIDGEVELGADIRKVDIKITTNGKSGKETRYNFTPLTNIIELTKSQIEEAAKIKLDEVIKNGIRLSEVNKGEELPVVPDNIVEPTEAEMTVEDLGGLDTTEQFNLDDIPF